MLVVEATRLVSNRFLFLVTQIMFLLVYGELWEENKKGTQNVPLCVLSFSLKVSPTSLRTQLFILRTTKPMFLLLEMFILHSWKKTKQPCYCIYQTWSYQIVANAFLEVCIAQVSVAVFILQRHGCYFSNMKVQRMWIFQIYNCWKTWAARVSWISFMTDNDVSDILAN